MFRSASTVRLALSLAGESEDQVVYGLRRCMAQSAWSHLHAPSPQRFEPAYHSTALTEPLAETPLADVHLVVPEAHVVSTRIAEDVIERVPFRDVLRRPSEDDRELNLVVRHVLIHRLRTARDSNRSSWVGERRWRLNEQGGSTGKIMSSDEFKGWARTYAGLACLNSLYPLSWELTRAFGNKCLGQAWAQRTA